MTVVPNYPKEKFEAKLTELIVELDEIAKTQGFENSTDFQEAVRSLSVVYFPEFNVEEDPTKQQFPDVPIGQFGIEAKFTKANSWRCVGNSIFEGTRNEDVETIYIAYCKMGGTPEVRFRLYDDAICHVRTSHVPRFEVSMEQEARSLFSELGISYHSFSLLPDEEKMPHIRKYARSRLSDGEHLWWLEDDPDNIERSMPLQARLYVALEQQEQRILRAEAALLCPQILSHSRDKKKYWDVALFMLSYHGVAAHQARDLYSAGSAANDGICPGDPSLNGNYVACSLFFIQNEMRNAALYLPDELFLEYWHESCPPSERISRWLQKADEFAAIEGRWVPSQHLFLDK